MIKVKDGYAKLIGENLYGDVNRVLLSNGGDKIIGNASGNIPINNGTINTNLNAELLGNKSVKDFRHTKIGEFSITPNLGHYGSMLVKPTLYYKISITGVTNIWTMLNLEISLTENHGTPTYGKLLIYIEKNASNNLTSKHCTLVGNFSVLLKVYCYYDGDFNIYIAGDWNYPTIEVTKALFGDTAATYSAKDITLTYIDSLPSAKVEVPISIGLTSTNYTTYTVTKTGGGASGTWGINISGNADTVDNVHLEWAGSQEASNTPWLAGWNSDGTKIKAVSQANLSVKSAQALGDGTMNLYALYTDEINFGGSAENSTIYFGYRATDSKPIPTEFVFGRGLAALKSGSITVRGSIFLNTGDATLKVYSGKVSDAKSDGSVCFLTCIDNLDGETHLYSVDYPIRNNIILLPRGGQVYIGHNPGDSPTANYKLNVGGKVYATGYYTETNDRYKLLRSDGGFATFTWSGQSGLPNWVWGGNGIDTYYIYNPANFKVALAAKLGDSTVGAPNRPIYLSSGSPAAITSFGEAFLSWGGLNFSGGYGPIDAAMIPVLGANRLAFVNPDKVSVEYSTDSGTTWTDYYATNDQKTALFCGVGSAALHIGKSGASEIDKTAYLVRITLTTKDASVYTTLNKFAIYISTNGSSGCYCTVTARLQSNIDSNINTWKTFADKISVSGWAGWNIINLTDAGLTTYGNNAPSLYGQIRFTFGVESHPSTVKYNGLVVYYILGFGGMGHYTPSNMARFGTIYAYDTAQRVTFPASVTSTGFIKSSSSDSYVLLGGGGHKLISDVVKGGYIGTTLVQSSSTALALTGITTADFSGDITLSLTNTDRFINLRYTNTGYDWRIGNLGSGSGDANYFVIQSDKTGTTYYDALKIGCTSLKTWLGGELNVNGLAEATSFKSTAATGTQPYACTSTTLNTNLNADLLDGKHASEFSYNMTSNNYDCNNLPHGTHSATYRFNATPTNAFPGADYGNLLVIGAGQDTMTQIGASYHTDALYFRRGTWYSDGSGTINNNAWRTILHDGNSSVSGGGSTWGSSITVNIGGTSATLTMPSNPNTDLNVKQGVSANSKFRCLLLGTTLYDSAPTSPKETTGQAYITKNIYVNPSNATLYATTFSGALSGNATSATKLATARTLWGLSFDGSANISGSLSSVTNIAMSGRLTVKTSIEDHSTPMYLCIAIDCGAPPEGTTVTNKNAPGIGFHISTKSWASLVFTGTFRFINSDTTAYADVAANKFIKADSSNSYVLLGGGGHKALSDFVAADGGTSTNSNYLAILDIRGTDHLPNSDTYPEKHLTAWFNKTGTPSSAWYSGITVKGWTNDYATWLLCGISTSGTATSYNLYFRHGINDTWDSWKTILDSSNSSVSKSGETLSVKINGTTQSLTNTTYSAGIGLSLSGTTFNINAGNEFPVGDSNLTDGTLILTSYASNNGFDDTNAVGTVYKRNASCIYGYIKGKLDSVYQAKGTYLTSHQTIYNLTLLAGAFSATTFDPNGSAKTVNIPTHTSHLTNDSGFITSTTLNNYLQKSGGTMTGSIITPKDDSMGIIPDTDNYGLIGSSTKKFYRMYASTFYGNLSGTATKATLDADGNNISDTYFKYRGQLTSGVDFNTYFNGSYVNTTGNGSGNTNNIHNYGYLLAFPGAVSSSSYYSGVQIAIASDSRFHFRVHWNYAWSDWARLITTNDIDKYLPLSGGTMTGAISMGSNALYFGASNNYFLQSGNDGITILGGIWQNGYFHANNYLKADKYIETSGYITAVGSLSAESGKFYTNSSGAYWSSDRRLKDNINSARNLNIDSLIKEFDWKDTGKHSWGFIALELLEVLPEAVNYNEDTDRYSVNYDVAHSAAIASLNAKIKLLELRIKELEDGKASNE